MYIYIYIHAYGRSVGLSPNPNSAEQLPSGTWLQIDIHSNHQMYCNY